MVSRSFFLLTGLVLLVAAVVVACGPGAGAVPTSGPSGQTVNVEGSEFSYTPGDITAKPGQTITVNFKNTGSVEHTFVIREPKVNLDFKIVAQPGQTKSGTFTAPTTPGVYQIHCDVPGHTEAGMQGKLTVNAASN